MSELDDLEEIARQATIRVNEKTRTSRSGGGFAYAPQANIVRAAIHAAHPAPPQEPPLSPAPEPIPYPDDPFGPSKPVTSYTELIGEIREQIGRLGVRLVDFDDLAGFPAGLSGKVFGPAQVKRLGPEKVFDALRACGMRLSVEIDPEQMDKMRQRIADNYNPRQGNQARPNNHASPISKHLMSRVYGHFLKEARKKRWTKTTKLQRSEHARMMSMARIKKKRLRLRRNRAKRQSAAHRVANEERAA